MRYKPDFEEAVKRTEAFWYQEMIDRPLVCVTAPKKEQKPISLNKTVPFSPENCFQACMSEEYDDILDTYDAIAQNTFFGGEAMPQFEVTLGPDQYAGFLGATMISKPGYITTWTDHCVEDWSQFEVKIDKSPDGYYNKVKKFIEYAAQHYADRFLINMLDLHSNMDALSALRGPQELCMDLYDCPEEVMRVLNEVRKTYPDIYEMAYQAGDMENRGTIGWSPIYCKGKSAVMQCDFSCMISPELVRQFVIPALEEEAAYLDRRIYHYDGKEALSHLDDILAIKQIECIQWVPGDGQPRSVEWMDLLKQIQKAGKSVWIYDWTVEEIKAYYKELEPNKLAFSVAASTQDEAEELLEYLTVNC